MVAPLLLRLPGRATTAAILLGLLLIAAAVVALRDARAEDEPSWPDGLVVALIVVAVASIPFAVSGHTGVLGEGIYTNDHAAQLYWADWLQHGFGPEPSAVRFGYPIGPQAVAVIAAEVTGASLVSAFNGLLLSIPVLTGLTALAALTEFPRGRRIAIAALVGLPYLAASFMAQSAFKETAMALFVLAFALALAAKETGAEGEPARASWRPVIGICVLIAGGAVFTFSVPGLAWLVIAVPVWLAIEAIAGRSPVDWSAIGASIRAHRTAIAIGLLILIAVAAFAYSPVREFASKIAGVQESAGRLSSPVFGGEALGIWPAGDFRVVRGEVSGSLIAAGIATLALLYGVWTLIRLRRLALLSVLITGGIVYLGTRAFAEIHVQAKALAVIAPLAILISLYALLRPTNRRATSDEQRPHRDYAAGTLVFIAAALSTLIALRDAPIGFDTRQLALERLADRAAGEPVAFLGVDRFAGYYLRETLARAPAGYVPEEIAARPEKTWQQGLSADFDTLDPGQLDKFDYAITTASAYNSTPPPNFERVAADGDYVLWKRGGETPRSKVLPGEGHDHGEAIFQPGATLNCPDDGPRRPGTAVVLAEPAVATYTDWNQPPGPGARVAGQERGFQAPGTATIPIDLPRAGDYRLSLQYHSQVPLTVLFDGEPVADLPASLDGMYLSGAGRGAYWPAGEVSGATPASTRSPSAPPSRAGSRRRSTPGGWSGSATPPPRRMWRRSSVSLADACDAVRRPLRLPARGRWLMPHFGTPEEAASPVLGGETPERADEVAKLVFVGGTGRSGTHVLSQLISRHNRYGLVPVEVRFHTDPEGFPGLLAGEVTPEQFVRRMRGFWWRGFQTSRFRGMYRFVDRDRFDAAVARFEADHDDLEAACRRLFYDLLWFRVGEGVQEDEENPRGEALVEQSTDTVAAAPTLARLFPEARFIHVVRDGRDASASRVAQTRGLVRPRTRAQGIEWWERADRARSSAAPTRSPKGRMLTVSLDELVRQQRARAALRPLFRFLGVPLTKRTRRYFSNRMTTEEANKERWREGISARKAERIDALYREALDRLEASGARSAPLLRHSLERRDEDLDPLVYVYDRGPNDRDDRDTRGPGLRRRHRPQRHAHPQLPARPPLALSRGADRVPLSLQPEGARRCRRRPRPSPGSSSASCAATGGTGCGSATAPTCGRSGGRSGAAASAGCLDRPAGALRGRRDPVRARLTATTSSAPRGRSSTTSCSRSPTRPASRCWSR